MENKVEDPVAAVDAFRTYLKRAEGDVALKRKGGTVDLQVHAVSGQLPEVQGRSYVKTAVRELDPVLTQLQSAGAAVNKAQITLSRLTETLTLDAETGRIESHRVCAAPVMVRAR